MILVDGVVWAEATGANADSTTARREQRMQFNSKDRIRKMKPQSRPLFGVVQPAIGYKQMREIDEEDY
jgi:hypothetical protein